MQAMARVSLFGTPRGIQSPCQNEMDMPGMPASPTVRMWGAPGSRVFEVTAKALSVATGGVA